MDEAIAILQRALATDPDDVGLLEELAWAQWRSDPAAARTTALRLVSRAPENGEGHYVAALSCLDLGLGKEGLEHARRMVALAPNRSASHALLADALARRRRKRKEALAAAARAIELDPDSLPGFVAAGNVELAHRRWRNAETWYRRALELDPHSSVAQRNLIVAQQAGGRLAPAFSDAQALLRFDPRDADARRALDGLVFTTLLHLQWIVLGLATVALVVRG